MMQTKRSLAKRFLVACFPVMLCAPMAHAEPDLPYSLSGDLLGGIVSMQRNNIADADIALSAAIQHGLKEPAFIAMAMRYAAMDSGPEAAARAAQLAALLPKENLAKLILGNAALHDRQWQKAVGYYTPSPVSGGFLNIAGPSLRAWSLYGAGQGHLALGRLQAETRHDIMGSLNALQAARIAAALNDGRASSLFAQARAHLELTPPILRVMITYEHANWLARQGKRAEAERELHSLGDALPAFQLVSSRLRLSPKATPLTPQQGAASFYVGLSALLGEVPVHDATDDSQAKEMRQFNILMLRQALWLQPDLTLAKILLGEELRTDKQLDAAQAVLEGVSADDPLAPLSDHTQAQIALQRHDLQAALRALQRVAVADPNNPDVLNELAVTQDQLGQSDAAVATFTRAISHISVMQARVWPLLLGRAIAYDHLHQRDKAQADLDRALALAPREPMLLNYAGYSAVEHDEQPKRALELLKRAVEVAPDDPEIRDSYAWALLKQQGDLQGALPLLLSSANAAPSDPEIAYHLGVAYWYEGRQLEARDQWNQALNDKPEPETRTLIEAALAHGPDLAIMRGHPIPASK
ncbi:tetratricopeptide repeat protein [Kozakia baliensis]|uniref:tetratricopeptide repeat protein n=1 Tax=Kozakia baliensis TaxID=153496 RepID=UPI000495DE12|nr:tetratricopeptide repeat protein [Kozakia baliensis]AOX20480.1 hypothetical protein A0U90_09395 [Kozakia baliensis]